MRIYLDHNATTPVDPAVKAAMVRSLDVAGNPSSIHAEGRIARDLVETARRQVAALVGADPTEIVFTSSGTEADALGIVGLAAAAGSKAPARVAAAAIDHPAVAGALTHLAGRGVEPVTLAVDGDGVVDPDELARHCRDGVAVVVITLANHELGTLQDVRALADIARAHGALVHCDAVQAAGKLPLAAAELGVDALAVSAHKLYGPKGAGALWIRNGVTLAPLIGGGHQERERRPGTENLPGIVGFGAAAALAVTRLPDTVARVTALRDRLERGLAAIDGARVHAARVPRVCNTTNAAFAGAPGDIVVTALDLAGVAVSTGAACTSGSVRPSPVLLATGHNARSAGEAIRISLGVDTTPSHIEQLLELLPSIISRARTFS